MEVTQRDVPDFRHAMGEILCSAVFIMMVLKKSSMRGKREHLRFHLTSLFKWVRSAASAWHCLSPTQPVVKQATELPRSSVLSDVSKADMYIRSSAARHERWGCDRCLQLLLKRANRRLPAPSAHSAFDQLLLRFGLPHREQT